MFYSEEEENQCTGEKLVTVSRQTYFESVECLRSVAAFLGSFLSAGFFPAGSFLACRFKQKQVNSQLRSNSIQSTDLFIF